MKNTVFLSRFTEPLKSLKEGGIGGHIFRGCPTVEDFSGGQLFFS
jgi:hypothetical protein